MFILDNELRPYAWGSTTAIAGLLGTEASGAPEAELWLGAHPDSPSRVAGDSELAGQGLDALIAADPERLLGAASVAAFGARLPFLMKVLAAGAPLSLQVHPSLAQAAEGFRREDEAGVPRAAANRNYKDTNHKPEMILALTPFRALCGFRAEADAQNLFAALCTALPQLSVLHEVHSLLQGPEPYRAALSYLLGSADPQELAAATAGVAGLGEPGHPSPTGELSTWALPLEVAHGLQEQYRSDPGVLISLLLNTIELAPGESVYLPAGNVHAYLHGLGIEVMANSDNVLRGGLTPKHVDVPELMSTIDFRALPVPELKAVRTPLGENVFAPPFGEFALQDLVLEHDDAAAALYQDGAAIVLVVEGTLRLETPKGELVLKRGNSAFVPAVEAPVTVHHLGQGRARAFVATTGLAALGSDQAGLS